MSISKSMINLYESVCLCFIFVDYYYWSYCYPILIVIYTLLLATKLNIGSYDIHYYIIKK